MSTSPSKILVVDDCREDRYTYRRFLEQSTDLSYTILETNTGEEGLALAREESPACILLDYRLPDITGLEFIKKFSAFPGANYTAIVMVTGHGDEVIAVTALKDGAMDYLVKEHLTAGALCRAISNAVKKVELRREIQQRHEELLRESITDELTGVHNRRYTMVRLSEEMERSKRYSTPLSILMLDLDHFKKVNDSYGHLAGDEVLRNFSDMLTELSRSTDVVGRFGGEEFIVILTDTHEHYAHHYAERICELLKLLKHKVSPETEIQITCSIGIASSEKSLSSVSAFIARADSALYEAKDLGRDQVCLWPHLDKKPSPSPRPSTVQKQ